MQLQNQKLQHSSSNLKKTSLLLFWDYDTQWGAERSRAHGGAKNWGKLEFENTDRILEILDNYNISACFGVVGAAALPGNRPYHDPTQIRRIHALGHEIASHSMYHDWLPALGNCELLENLRESKDALEQCIGGPVVTFVPPYNQPFDHWRKTSISISERREAGKVRTDLYHLCLALQETGYKYSRVSYRPIWQRLAERVFNKRIDYPSNVETIAGITCIRLNTTGGFDSLVQKQVARWSNSGKYIVVYGHPHSLKSSNSQNEIHLLKLLDQIQRPIKEGRLEVRLPQQLVS